MNKYIDHTQLKAFATENDIKKLCQEAVEYKFFSVCINSAYLELAKKELKGSTVKICCVACFPLGANALNVKLKEIEYLINNGCDEVDFVINVGYVKDAKFDEIKKEFDEIRKISKNKIIKVILETCYLTNQEIRKVCELADAANIDFVKTSTGFGSDGAKVEDVKLMKESVSQKTNVKASGGIKSYEDAKKMIDAGATRLGTSNGIAIVNKKTSNSDY